MSIKYFYKSISRLTILFALTCLLLVGVVNNNQPANCSSKLGNGRYTGRGGNFDMASTMNINTWVPQE